MRKIKKTCLIAAAISLVLAGCTDKKKISSYETDNSEGIEITEQSNENVSYDGSELLNKIWNETYETEGNISLRINFNLTTKSELKPADISVISYKEYEKNKENILKIIEALYGDNKVYKNDEKDYPKYVIRNMIESDKETIEKVKNEATLRDYYQSLMEDVERLEKLLKNAPEDYILVDEPDSDNYFGYIDYKRYDLLFENLYVGGEKSTAFIFNRIREGNYYAGDNIIPEEEAKEVADAIIEKMDFVDCIYAGSEVQKCDFDENINEYIFRYRIGNKLYERNAFVNFNGISIAKNEIAIVVSSNADEGLRRVVAGDLMVEEKRDEEVALLSLDNIKDCIKNEINTNREKYITNLSGNLYYSEMVLGHVQMKDISNGIIYQIPCWKLGATLGVTEEIYINAMDGSVIEPDNIDYEFSEEV